MTNIYVWSEKGARPTMEDTHIVEPHFLRGANDGVNASLFAIFDGHAGGIVSRYLHNNFSATLKSFLLPFSIDNVPKALDDTFECCNRNLFEYMKKLGIAEGGSTAVVALIIENSYLFVANCGDAEAITYSKSRMEKDKTVAANTACWSKRTKEFKCNVPNETVLCATRKHKPYYESEYTRIVNAGGLVYRRRVEGLLAISRSFGDFDFIKESPLVIADPFICGIVLTPGDILILACDGLWDVYSYTEAISDTLDSFKKPQENIARVLADNAIIKKLSSDNVSIIVVQNGKRNDKVTVFDQQILLKCHSCHKKHSSIYFSKRQIQKGSERRCKLCLGNL